MSLADSDFWSIIPAGGAGTRLWPVSRVDRPKFLLPLVGKRTLLQQTYDRLLPLSPPERIVIVAGANHVAEIARQIPEVPPENIVVEPSPKGTGPAIGLASLLIGHRAPGAMIGSFAADHVIEDGAGFESAVKTAVDAATEGWLVTIGIQPDRAETGYGYIERTNRVIVDTATHIAYEAVSFREKPDSETAQHFLEDGKHLWNASMFIWSADKIDAAFRIHEPDTHRLLTTIIEDHALPGRESAIAALWAEISSDTIDQGIMEKVNRFAVVPADFGWSDIGDWNSIGSISSVDLDGNSGNCDFVSIASNDCVVWSETGRQIAISGLDQIAVVDTEDALLVVDRRQSQSVKQIVDKMKRERFDLT